MEPLRETADRSINDIKNEYSNGTKVTQPHLLPRRLPAIYVTGRKHIGTKINDKTKPSNDTQTTPQ